MSKNGAAYQVKKYLQHHLINDDMTDFNSNKIHPTAIIGDDVQLGVGNTIEAYVVIADNTAIGNNNHFYPHCSIGTPPEHKSFYGSENKGVVIGSNNVIREYVTINAGCYRPTRLGNSIWMLRGSHAGHDALIWNNCTISCNVLIGGHSVIGEYANLGLGAIIHQFSVIGGGAMIGMGTVITKKSKIEPLGTYVGNPAKLLKENAHIKSKLSQAEIDLILIQYDYYIATNKL
jgi:UDP-N-acetylglucosamine acyltransferase